MFYSPSTGGFYSREINGDAIPADAIPLQPEAYQALIEGQSAGKQIVAGPDGMPILQDPTFTDAQLATAVIADRDQRLADSDKVAWPFFDRGQPLPAAWAAYRQALRDVPTQAGFPRTINWPKQPAA